jgi:FixJ family two-component response regulator
MAISPSRLPSPSVNAEVQTTEGRLGTSAQLLCIVDDDASVRRSLKRLFGSAGCSAESFASAEDYLRREAFEGPVCLVLDVRMPGLNGLDLQEAIESRGACEQIVFITGHSDVPTCRQAMKNGAVDFLLKPFDADELLEAVKRALIRARDCREKRSERRAARRRIDTLTPREFEVLRFVLVGLLNKEIAGELNTAEKTIKVHRGRVMQKLGLTSVADLVRFSQSAGVAPADAPYGTGIHDSLKHAG